MGELVPLEVSPKKSAVFVLIFSTKNGIMAELLFP